MIRKRIAKILTACYILMVLSMGMAFSAGSNRLDIYGIAYVMDFRLDMLPVFPLLNSAGSYFSSTNLPVALTHGDEAWIEDTFYLNIVKPPSVANNGMNNFTMTFDVLNPTVYTWTSGLAEAVIVRGIYSTVGATLSSATISPNQKLTITFTFRTKIDIGSFDEARVSVSYIVGGIRRYIYINIIMRPV